MYWLADTVINGTGTSSLASYSQPIVKWPPTTQASRWLLQYEYVLPKPTNFPGADNPRRIHTAKVISRRQPGFATVIQVATKLKPDNLTVNEIQVLGVLKIENPADWPGNWLDLRPQKDSDDDI